MEKKVFTIPAQKMTGKEIASAIRPAVLKLLAKKTVASYLRKQVDERANAILAQKEYRDDEGKRITENQWSWMIADDNESKKFIDLVDQANRAAGWDGPEGYCPALVAEDEERKAVVELVNAAEPLTTIQYRGLLNLGPKKLKEYVDNLISLYVSFPG